MNGRKRIAIYGGTFDPVHLGHLEVARRVSELFEIDEFLFVPARVAPHKLDATCNVRATSLCDVGVGDPGRAAAPRFDI